MAAGEVTVEVAMGVTVAPGTGDVTTGEGEAVGRGVGAWVGAGAAAMIGAGAGASTWGAHCAAEAGAVTTARKTQACLAGCNNATKGSENRSANKYHAMLAALVYLVLKAWNLDK